MPRRARVLLLKNMVSLTFIAIFAFHSTYLAWELGESPRRVDRLFSQPVTSASQVCIWGSSAICQNITWHCPLSFKAFKDVVYHNVSNIGKYMGFSVSRLPFFKVVTQAVFLLYLAFKTSAGCQCELLTHCFYLLTCWIQRLWLWDQFCMG